MIFATALLATLFVFFFAAASRKRREKEERAALYKQALRERLNNGKVIAPRWVRIDSIIPPDPVHEGYALVDIGVLTELMWYAARTDVTIVVPGNVDKAPKRYLQEVVDVMCGHLMYLDITLPRREVDAALSVFGLDPCEDWSDWSGAIESSLTISTSIPTGVEAISPGGKDNEGNSK